MNFPTRHPLNQSDRARAVIIGCGRDPWSRAPRFLRHSEHLQGSDGSHLARLSTKPTAKLISINANDLYIKGNYQDFQRYQEVDLDIAADAEATLPSLTEAVKRLMTDDRKRAVQDRGVRLAKAHQHALARNRDAAALRLGRQPHQHGAALAPNCARRSKMKTGRWFRGYTFVSQLAASACGVSTSTISTSAMPEATGSATAPRRRWAPRWPIKNMAASSVNIQSDGDLMYAPGVLWTAAHHKIPLLHVMHNNHAYHQELMQVQIMADRHSRDIDDCVTSAPPSPSPMISYAKLAQSMGMYGDGPDLRSERSGAGHPPRARSGEARRTGAA